MYVCNRFTDEGLSMQKMFYDSIQKRNPEYRKLLCYRKSSMD